MFYFTLKRKHFRGTVSCVTDIWSSTARDKSIKSNRGDANTCREPEAYVREGTRRAGGNQVSMCCSTFCGQPSASCMVSAVPYGPSPQQFFCIYSNTELSLSFCGFQESVSLGSVQPPSFFSPHSSSNLLYLFLHDSILLLVPK